MTEEKLQSNGCKSRILRLQTKKSAISAIVSTQTSFDTTSANDQTNSSTLSSNSVKPHSNISSSAVTNQNSHLSPGQIFKNNTRCCKSPKNRIPAFPKDRPSGSETTKHSCRQTETRESASESPVEK